jgi:hypothetical protein
MKLPAILHRFTRLSDQNWRKIIAVSVFAFALLILLASVYATLSREKMAQEIAQTRNYLSSLSGQINNTLLPEDIELGQRDTALSTIIASSEALADAAKDSPRLPNTAMVRFNLGIISAQAREVSPAYKNYQNSVKEVGSLATHHRDVLTILQLLLEYNPRADMAGEMPADERKSRVSVAKEAITDMQTQLRQKQPLNESDDLAGINTELEAILAAAGKFENDPNTDAWITAVDSAQNSILSNRQSFWESSSSSTRQTLISSGSSLARIQNSLR